MKRLEFTLHATRYRIRNNVISRQQQIGTLNRPEFTLAASRNRIWKDVNSRLQQYLRRQQIGIEFEKT